MKDSFYLKHDLDARDDEKMRALLIKSGARGYGIYWMVIEDLYRNNGRLKRDYAALAWSFHEDAHEIKAVVECYDFFYDDDGRIACRRVDRALAERREAARQASAAGKASALKRLNAQSNGRSTTVQPGEERRGEEGKEITTAPLAVDFTEVRFPYGKDKGRFIADMAVDECQFYLRTDDRMGARIIAALKARIAAKESERV